MDHKLRILLVDDDVDIVWGVGRCLTRAGFAVVVCGDGDEAIATLKSQCFDVLVTDIQMPRLNGIALIEWARQHHPQMRLVAITAFGSPSVKQATLRKGAILYLEKPMDPNLLIEVLRAEDTANGEVEGVLRSCMEAAHDGTGGEVVVRAGNQVGRILFAGERVAWVTLSSGPDEFLGTLQEQLGLDGEVVQQSLARCREQGKNVFDFLVDSQHVEEAVFRALVLQAIAGRLLEMSRWPGLQALFIPMRRPYQGRITFAVADLLAAVRRLDGPDSPRADEAARV